VALEVVEVGLVATEVEVLAFDVVLDVDMDLVVFEGIDVLLLDDVVDGFAVNGVVKVVSLAQFMTLHLSLQSLRHTSVQFLVPEGQLHEQRSAFAMLKDQAPIRVPTASAYVSARPLQPH